MKVMHIHFGTEGGAERFFVNLVNALHERGVEQRALIRPAAAGARTWRTVLRSMKGFFGAFRFLASS